MSLEEFEPLKSFEELYLIHRDGRIWSLIKKKFLKPRPRVYVEITLRKEGKYYFTTLHRLLALQFIENQDNLPQTDHIDRNKHNNELINLRWVSHEDNMRNKTNYVGKENWKAHKKEYDRIRNLNLKN